MHTLPMLTEKEPQPLASTEEDKYLPTNSSEKITENILLLLSATNALVDNTDLTRADVYSTRLIPSRDSSYDAIYTALLHAHNILAWCCGDIIKRVISLDFDLYEKSYLLARTNTGLKDKFILCLCELHSLFAHVRAIGAFINGLGLEKT